MPGNLADNSCSYRTIDVLALFTVVLSFLRYFSLHHLPYLSDIAYEMQRQRDEALNELNVRHNPQAEAYQQYYASNIADRDVQIADLKRMIQQFSGKDIPPLDQNALAAENRRLSRQLEREKARTASYQKTIRFLERLIDGDVDASYEENPDVPVLGRPRSGNKKLTRRIQFAGDSREDGI